MSQSPIEYTILSAKGATGAGNAILSQDFKTAVFTVASDGGADAALTVKFQSANHDGATDGSPPAFGSAQSVTNAWDYVEVIDLQNGNPIDGDTGFSFTGSDDYRQFELNLNHAKYVCARVTAYTAGEVTVKVELSDSRTT